MLNGRNLAGLVFRLLDVNGIAGRNTGVRIIDQVTEFVGTWGRGHGDVEGRWQASW